MSMKKCVEYVLAWCVLVVIGAGAASSVHAADAVVTIKLREHTFAIPDHISLEHRGIPWLRAIIDRLEGLDDNSASTVFSFNFQLIAEEIAGYRVDDDIPGRDNITGLLYVAPPDEVTNYYVPSQQLRDLWQGKGRYEDPKRRVVVPAYIPGWYEVYQSYQGPNEGLWDVLTRFPDPNQPVPDRIQDFWVAICTRTSCGIIEPIGDIIINFEISHYNLHLLAELRAFMRAQVLEWKHDDPE